MDFKYKKIFIIVLGIIFFITFVGFASAKTTIKLAHYMPAKPEWSQHAAAMVFKSFIEARTAGEIEVVILPAGQVGSERSAIEQIQNNLLQMMVCNDGSLTAFVPEMQIFTIPYLFSSRTVAWDVLDGSFGKKLSDLVVKRADLRVLGWAENGFRHFTNSKKIIKSPSDMKGMKIRVMESPSYIAMVKGLGANPTPITWTELYSALQQNVVDGQENPINNIMAAKLYEVQKYLTLDGHTYGLHPWIMNNDLWNSLSTKNQQIIKDAAQMAVVAHRSASTMADVNGLEFLREQGVKIYAPTSDELEEFRRLTQEPVIEYLKEKIKGDWISELQENIKEIEKKKGF
jgi:TRAP-type transport system periplasmic protein